MTLVTACVISGDTVSRVLKQVTILVVAVIFLIIVTSAARMFDALHE
ncbi:hypothetical protein [Kitasatospora acidiphila]|nr:hypothetical protein [Kitasatospora acidiphila]